MSRRGREDSKVKDVNGLSLREYARGSMSNPFDVRSEPGSAWDKEQLNWLGVKFEEGHEAPNLIPRDRALKRSSKIYRNLTEEFGLSWSEVTSGPHGSRDYSLYDALEFLGRKRSPALV